MQYLLLFLLALGFEVLYTYWTLAVNHGQPYRAAAVNFCIPFFALAPFAALVDSPGWLDRVAVASLTGAGYSAGTLIATWLKR